ncbi:hypothetical protein EVG20_g1545 [Dentipellis fragilis]|uniref:Uncharacterized protein n=1 Tax=Dentipellis fragilis TaxID=205917 RepID=A0A4Y9ZCG4_9AGAM|nr:hypothetical protein EVG20_g1545 [Dentipellis fragilis]
MSGAEVAGLFRPLTDMVAGAIVMTILKPLPKNQVKAGETYLDRALILTEQHRQILSDDDKVTIEGDFKEANTKLAEYDTFKGVSLRGTYATSHEYKKRAKKAYKTAKHISDARRIEHAFAKQVADATIDVADKESIQHKLDEGFKAELHDNIVEAIESSPKVQEDSSYSNAEYAAAVAEGAWSQLTGILSFLHGQ